MDLSALFSNLSTERFHLWSKSLPTTPIGPRPVRQLQGQRRLKANEISDLIAQHEAGKSVRELTVEFGINRETVLEHLKRAGVARRPSVRKLTDTQVLEASQRYQDGLSLTKVPYEFAVDAGTIRREFTKAGIPVRPRRSWTD